MVSRMTKGRWSIAAVVGLASLACGPQVELEEEGSDAAAAESSTGPAATTAGPTTVGPITVTTDLPDETTIGVDPDDGDASTGPVFPEDCSQIEQDCPRGYKCMPYSNDGGGSWNDTMCVPLVPDPNGVGEQCTVEGNGLSGLDDCDGTSMCWDVDPETNIGTCAPFCIGDELEPTCPDPCDSCSVNGDGVIALCLGWCDPLIQNCDPDQACYPFLDEFVCAPDASPEGTGIASPCEFINVCPPSMACLDGSAVPGCPDGSVGCCAPFCPVGGADPCPGLLPGSSCVAWFEEGDGPQAGCLSASPGVCVQE